MAAPSAPSNFIVQTANNQVLLTWSPLQLAATVVSYLVNRGTDGVNFTFLANLSGSTANQVSSYVDTTAVTGTAYYYQISVTTPAGTSPYNTYSIPIVPTMTGEMSLGAIRLAAQQRADRVNSNFVTTQEWNFFINQSMFELYDILVTTYEDYFLATPAQFTTNNSSSFYPLPDGKTTYQNGLTQAGGYIAPPFYKLWGVDLGINTASNAYVTLKKFNPIDRNRYVYPNSNSTIYGIYNMQYRLMGNQIEFIPVPAGSQNIRLWYIPRLNQLLQDSDVTTQGISGWLQYVIIRAAKYALNKEESDTSSLDIELVALNARIEQSAMNRDAGQADTIQDVRRATYWGGNGDGGGWGPGGWS